MFTKLTKKQKEEKRLKKEQIKKEHFEQFKSQLDDDYFDMYSDDFEEFYEFFRNSVDVKGLGTVQGKLPDFIEFVDKYSNDRELFRREKIAEYEAEPSDPDSDEEDEDENYDFLYTKGNHFI